MTTPNHDKLLLAADWCNYYEGDDSDLTEVVEFLREKALGGIYKVLSKKYGKSVPDVRKIVSKNAKELNTTELNMALAFLEKNNG